MSASVTRERHDRTAHNPQVFFYTTDRFSTINARDRYYFKHIIKSCAKK